jgi:ATP:ADP antiporter, AAA family
MYMITAALTLAVGAVSSNIGARFGQRRALIVAQLASAAGTATFFFLPPTKLVLTGLYALSAVSGALLVPQLWATGAALFHAGQGRRLFGTIAIAGVLGAVLGTSAAAGALLVLDLRWLLLVSAAAFVLSSSLIALAPQVRRRPAPEETAHHEGSWWRLFQSEPLLPHLALIVALGATTMLFADYLFKAVAAARIPPEHLGSFFARYYTAMNLLALLVQIVVARRVLARAGVVGTASLMPSLMLAGSVLSFLSGGTLLAVLGTKVVDGALRHSVQRTGLELVYLALPPGVRDRAKPIIDGAITRLSQAAAGGLILVLVKLGRGSPRMLALVAACSALGWVAATVSLRGPYVALFRRALLGPDRLEPRSPAELDLASVELLVEALGSPRPREVVAAIDALARRGRAGLLPALVLLRDEDEVLERALELFGSSSRSDWIHFCDRLLSDRRERVRRAAMRALARARHASSADARETDATAERPWLRGYLAIDSIVRGAGERADRLVPPLPDAEGREERLGMLTALSDASPEPALVAILVEIVDRTAEVCDRETVELIARAAANLRATALVPRLVGLLALRDRDVSASPHGVWRGAAEGRSRVRVALASLGHGAFEHIANALLHTETPRRLRIHLPLALAEFGTQEGADLLFRFLRDGDDGLVRYRCLRALEQLVTDHGVRLVAVEVRAAVQRELAEFFRLLALRFGLASDAAPPGVPEDTWGVVLRLLDEKREQARARAFRLLKLCFPSEDLRQVYTAIKSGDAAKRANAMEFLDALLAPRPRHRDDGVRALLRLATEDLPDAERLVRAAAVVAHAVPHGAEAAIALLRKDRDAMLAALAVSLAEEYARTAPQRPRERPQSTPESETSIPGVLRPAGAHGR